MDTIELVRNYLINPYEFWGEGDRRALKVEKRVRNARISLGRARAEDVMDELQDVAARRLTEANASLYVCNAGSSGSHWVQGIISAIAPVLPCGEVYLPKKVLTHLKTSATKGDDSRIALHLIYLIHAFLEPMEKLDREHLSSSLACNTAHTPLNLHMYRAADIKNHALLLLRDPADIAISRTFRKEQHRAYIGKAGGSDMDFLKFNCDFITNFYNEVSQPDFDVVIRYEDLLKTPAKIVKQVCSVTGINASDKEIKKATSMFSKENLSSESREAKTSNIYEGEKKKIDSFYIDFAREYLAPLRKQLGY